MKTIINKTVVLLSLVILSAVTLQLNAQTSSEAENYITVSGVVKSQQSHKAIEFATVTLKGTNVGTVTNEDGEFTLKHVEKHDDHILLVPGNKKYQSIRITADNHFVIWGVVRYVIKKL